MSEGAGQVLPFNRVLRRFGDDLARPDYRAKIQALETLCDRYAGMARRLRRDLLRQWEHAHVLLELDRLVAARAATRPIASLLDVGGGNSPLAYHLAEQGLHTVVLDTDPAVVEAVGKNSRELQWGMRLTAAQPRHGRWPFLDDSFDCMTCISVFEGVLRQDRPRFWAEIRRTLRPGCSLLMTFDFGPEARYVGDPPTTVPEILSQIVAPSGLELVGDPPREPVFDADLGPPVKAVVPTVDGLDWRAIAYSFAALHLRRPG